jgi:hypothetical protein
MGIVILAILPLILLMRKPAHHEQTPVAPAE